MSALLEAIKWADPARTALEDERHALSYGQLAARLAAEQHFLAACGGQRVALLAANGIAWALADLALHAGGRLSVPVPDYFTPAQQLQLLEAAGIDSILTDCSSRVQELLSGLSCAGRSPASGLTLLRRTRPGSPPELPAPAIAKVTFTSGSTAEPKGVCLGGRTLETVAQSLVAATAALRLRRHLCLMPLTTLLENVAGLYAPLLTGATCLVPAATETGMHFAGIDAPRLLRAIARAGPESLVLVPELLRLLVRAAEAGWRVPPTLRFIAVGGAPVSAELLEQAAALELPVFEGYGLSECASVVCLNTPGAQRRGSVGRPLRHAQVSLGERGEIMVRGALMAGYLGLPGGGKTGAVATGDLGECDDEGYLYVRGRLGNVFITSLGRNLSPEWIERELTQETVIRAALVSGEGRPHAVALVQPARADLDDASIERAIARANARLPAHAQVRGWARFPEAPSFGNGLLTANGRLRRAEILARCRALLAGCEPARSAGRLTL